MKIAHLADLHARASDIDPFRRQFAAACETIAARKCDLVVCSGDVFDKSVIGDAAATHDRVADAVNSGLAIIPPYVPIVGCCGNHDYRSQNAPPRTLACPRMQMAWNEPDWIEPIPGVWALLFPWQWQGNAAEALKRAVREMPDRASMTGAVLVLCAHVQVDGANMAKGRACGQDDPLDAPLDRPGVWRIGRGLLVTLTAGSLPVFHRIFLGDFHARQDLTEGRGGYGGALRQLDRGEIGNPQGFEIWDSETGAVEWIELEECKPFRELEPHDVAPLDNLENVVIDNTLGELDAAECAELSRRGAAILMPELAEPEREARGEPIPPGAVNDPHALLRLQAEAEHMAPELHWRVDVRLREFTAQEKEGVKA